jgi:hypothetical protein
MKPTRLIPLLALALLLAACGGGLAARSSSASEPMMAAPDAPVAQPAAGATAIETGGAPRPPADMAQPDQQAMTRLVIKNADLSLQVASARDAEASVRALVAKLGGYVVKVETSGADESLSSRISFRVPAERFDEALSGVQGLAKKVLSRTVSGDDVTEEFVDIESRLKNLAATRDRLQSFLDKATTVEDALKVNQSLSDIQGQIEQLKGRQQFLKQSASLSTVSVSLSPVPAVAPIVNADGWQPIAVAREALRGLVGFGQELANVVIVALVWAPVWLSLLLLALWLRRRLSRGRAATVATPEQAA